eukprot:5722374-Pyramimonas_sp.AAC.1
MNTYSETAIVFANTTHITVSKTINIDLTLDASQGGKSPLHHYEVSNERQVFAQGVVVVTLLLHGSPYRPPRATCLRKARSLSKEDATITGDSNPLTEETIVPAAQLRAGTESLRHRCCSGTGLCPGST